jgi:hypothetical protein
MSVNRKTLASAGVVATAAACAAIAAGSISGAPNGEARTARKAADTVPFAVLRRPQAADDLSGNPFDRKGVPDRRGIDPSSARKLGISRDVWAARSDSYVCIRMQSAFTPGVFAGACTPAETAPEYGVFLSSHPAPDVADRAGLSDRAVEAAGLLPDGVASIRLTLADGTTKAIEVVDNGFAALLPDRPTGIRFTDSSGNQHNVQEGR